MVLGTKYVSDAGLRPLLQERTTETTSIGWPKGESFNETENTTPTPNASTRARQRASIEGDEDGPAHVCR
eukprot:6439789-Lingulodinium_polyedra.AAC.1